MPEELDRAAALLQAGALVAFPTETVYGLGGSARDDHAVAAIYEAKGRPSFNPLIVHVSDMEMAQEIGTIQGQLLDLAEAFWPGPLTLLVPLKDPSISKLVTAGLERIAIRIPAHPLAQALIAKTGLPLAAPSANPSGRISPTTAQHVMAGLGTKISAVLDGGPCSVGLESTILGMENGQIACYRPGGLDLKDVARQIGLSIQQANKDQAKPNTPGQLLSHYAPKVSVRLNATQPEDHELFLDFGDVCETDYSLSKRGDLKEAAANLFRLLHLLDDAALREGKEGIAVAAIPEEGLGLAINDRLRRAAAPR